MTSKPTHLFQEHIGEVRVRVAAPTLPELFEEAARALAELLAEADGEPEEEELVLVHAHDRDALLVEWLNELVFRSETKKRVYCDVSVDHVSRHELRARIRGASVVDLRTPVKAATLHDLHVAEVPEGGYTASVVLDV